MRRALLLLVLVACKEDDSPPPSDAPVDVALRFDSLPPVDSTPGNDGNSEACPRAVPTEPTDCTGTLSCEYGAETCCGATYPALICQCLSGQFNCYATDACLIPGCPDAGN